MYMKVSISVENLADNQSAPDRTSLVEAETHVLNNTFKHLKLLKNKFV